MRLAVISALFLGAGTTLLLSQLRWFRRRALADRLRPYAPATVASGARAGVLSVESFREVIGPVAREVGGRLADAFGIDEDLSARLDRIHSGLDPTAFRVRQLAWAGATFGVALLVAIAATLPP